MKLKPFREWSTGWKVVAVLAGPILLMGHIFLGDLIRGALNNRSVVELAKREGAFITAEDLRQRYGAKESEDAAPILREAQIKYDSMAPARRSRQASAINALLWTKLYSNPARAPEAKVLAAAPTNLRDADSIIALLEQTLTKPRCDFAPNWELSTDVPFPQLTFMKHAVKLVAARAHVLARAGEIEKSVRTYRLALHLCRLSADTPTMIPALAACAGYALTYRQISHTLAVLAPDQAARFAAPMRAVLGDFVKPLDPRRVYEGEMYILRVAASDSEDSRFVPGVSTSNHTRVMEWCIETNRLLQQTPGDPIATSAISFAGNAPGRGLSYTLINMMRETHQKAAPAFVKVLANHDVLVSALELVEERQRIGRWPDALPVSRRDPFGARPIHYRRGGNQVRVWSIGPDYKDSRGAVFKEDDYSDDLVVRL